MIHRCSESCESRAICKVCGRRKTPIGRDSLDNGLCDADCRGYWHSPKPGHLWPGEFGDCNDPKDEQETYWDKPDDY